MMTEKDVLHLMRELLEGDVWTELIETTWLNRKQEVTKRIRWLDLDKFRVAIEKRLAK